MTFTTRMKCVCPYASDTRLLLFRYFSIIQTDTAANMTFRTAALRAKPSSNFESPPFASVVGTSVVYAVVVVVAAVVYAVAVVVAAEVYAVAVVVAAVVYAVAVVVTTVVVVVTIDGMRVMLVVTVFIVVVFSIFVTKVEASTVLAAVVIGEESLALVELV